MPVLDALIAAMRDATVEVIDLTARLEATTPLIKLPEPFGNTSPFTLHEISRYDERGPAWYWNDFSTGEHSGTHFDAPVHWVTGRDGEDVAQVPAAKLIAPAAVLDFSAQAAADPDFLLETDHVREWEREHGALPAGGWLLYRTGWDTRSHDQDLFLNANETGPHTPGVSVECARWLAEESPLIGFGTETVGTDAGTAHCVRPAIPVPLQAARRGQVRADPAAEPRPAARARRGDHRRAAADHRRIRQPVPGARPGGTFLMLVSEAVGAALAGLAWTPCSGWWAAGIFMSRMRWWRAARGMWRPGMRAAPPAWPTGAPGRQAGRASSPCIRVPG